MIGVRIATVFAIGAVFLWMLFAFMDAANL